MNMPILKPFCIMVFVCLFMIIICFKKKINLKLEAWMMVVLVELIGIEKKILFTCFG